MGKLWRQNSQQYGKQYNLKGIVEADKWVRRTFRVHVGITEQQGEQSNSIKFSIKPFLLT